MNIFIISLVFVLIESQTPVIQSRQIPSNAIVQNPQASYGPQVGANEGRLSGQGIADYTQMCQSIAQQTCQFGNNQFCTGQNCCNFFYQCCSTVCFYLQFGSRYSQSTCKQFNSGASGSIDPSQTFCVCSASTTKMFSFMTIIYGIVCFIGG